MANYQANAVFQPGRGGVFYADPDTEAPTVEAVQQWLQGAPTEPLGVWNAIGYTSVDDLPGIDSEQEGGEKMGVWENPDFRMSQITSTDSVTAKPVQWSIVPIRHRFGKNAKLDTATGKVSVPGTYVPVEVAVLVLILDGDRFLGIQYYRTSSAPDGGIELDREAFAQLPIKYNILQSETKTDKMTLVGYHLTADGGAEDPEAEDPEAETDDGLGELPVEE